MAARRVAKTSVDWAAIAERVPAKQGEAYRAFRLSSEKYLNRIVELPETLPKINFDEYRSRITNKAMVAEFEKLYASVQIAYPKDTSRALKKIEVEEKAALEHGKTVEATKKLDIQHFQQLKDAIKMVPPPEEMTKQMYNYYFPEYACNPNSENPGTCPSYGPGYQLDSAAYVGETFYNYKSDRRNVKTVEEFDSEAIAVVEKMKEADARKKQSA